MKKDIHIKHRHCPPSRFDIEPYGTICEVKTDTSIDYYYQIGDESNIDWITYDSLLTRTHGGLAKNKKFIGVLLFLLQEQDKSIEPIVDFMEQLIK